MLKTYQNTVLVIISGIATGLSIYHISYWLIWVALVPFLAVVSGQDKRTSFLYGLLFGIVEGSILFFWMVEGTQRYTGSSTLLGIPLYAVLSLYVALFPAFFGMMVSFLTEQRKTGSVLLSVLTASFFWVILEWVNTNIMNGVPWIKYTLGFTQATNLYGLQPVSVTGQWGVSFVVILINFYLALAIREKKVKTACFAIAGVFLFYFSGFLIFSGAERSTDKQISVAIIQENIKAETRWQERNGNMLANIFFDLNRQAAKMNPDIIVWSETALPWTFTKDDALLARALQITEKAKASHMVGILRQAKKPGKVYNSVYYMEPDGTVSGRYDKVDLLAFIEEPLLAPSLKIPFFSDGIFSNILPGKSFRPIHTTHGKFGILICNESLLPYPAKATVKNGADFLVNLSNDGWVEGTQLIDHHFYYARMRAVENRRDIIINSNKGYSGFINSIGEISERRVSDTAICSERKVYPRQSKSIFLQFGDWFVYIGISIIIIYLYILLQRGEEQ